MTCDTVLEALLDAAPSEISADGPTPLGGHLRECARCRRLGAQLVTDTRLLAEAMASSARTVQPAPRVRPAVIVPAVAFAAIVFVAVLRAGPASTPLIAPVVVSPPVTPRVSVNQPAPPSADPTRTVSSPRVRQLPVRRFPVPMPIIATRLERADSPFATESVVASRAVTVAPPSGTRAAVLHTTDPKIVVVWLY